MTSGTAPPACPFCERVRSGEQIAAENDLAVVFPDRFPLNPGHLLVVPRRHAAGYFDLTGEEQSALWALLPRAKAVIEAGHRPDGFNVGMNVGAAAGQTVDHVHLHLIPRYAGDVADPRGGVRWVVAERAAYWERPR